MMNGWRSSDIINETTKPRCKIEKNKKINNQSDYIERQ